MLEEGLAVARLLGVPKCVPGFRGQAGHFFWWVSHQLETNVTTASHMEPPGHIDFRLIATPKIQTSNSQISSCSRNFI
jgi:hypothetical protein